MEGALNKCYEWLEENSIERQLSATILAKDFFTSYFSLKYFRDMQFFNNIFKVIYNSKPSLRSSAILALQAALVVTSECKEKEKNIWFKRCFDEACVDSPKEDVLHASLLIFNELLRISNWKAEITRLKILDLPVNYRSKNVRFYRVIRVVLMWNCVVGNWSKSGGMVAESVDTESNRKQQCTRANNRLLFRGNCSTLYRTTRPQIAALSADFTRNISEIDEL